MCVIFAFFLPLISSNSKRVCALLKYNACVVCVYTTRCDGVTTNIIIMIRVERAGDTSLVATTTSSLRRPLLIFSFSRVVRLMLLLLLLIRRVNFFRSIQFFTGGFLPLRRASVRHRSLPRRRLHCLGPLSTTTATIRCGGGGHHTKIFTEPELIAGKGAHTHTYTHSV